MTVRCKMSCNFISIPNQYSGTEIRLNAVWHGTFDAQRASENAIFGDATPQANISMHIKNPEAARYFIPGVHYYVDFKAATEITPEILAPLRAAKEGAEASLREAADRHAADPDNPYATKDLGMRQETYALTNYHLEQALALFVEQQARK